MVWVNQRSFSFNQLAVFLKAPAKPGVYVLHTLSRCIYIGETENLRESLFGHLKGDMPWITVWDPTSFSFEVCYEARAERKNQLMAEFKPAIQECSSVSLHEPAYLPLH
jgi:hypothetical protein